MTQDAAKLEQEKLSQVLKYNREVALSNILLAGLVAVELWPAVPRWALLTWLMTTLLVAAIRYTVLHHFQKYPVQSSAEVSDRMRFFRAAVMLSGLVWGLSAWLVYGHHIDKYELFVAYMISGVSVAMAVVYLVDLRSALSTVYLGILPMMVMFLFSNDSALMTMSIAAAVFLLLTTATVKAFNQQLMDGIYLRWQTEQSAKENEQFAFFDALTGLPNRRLLSERLSFALTNAARTGKPLAVLFMDLNKFKELNDNHGHEMGDLLLKSFSNRLKKSMRQTDTVARLGGDEFVVILEGLNESLAPANELATKIASKLMVDLQYPYQLSETLSYQSIPSVGIAVSNTSGATTSDELIKYADIAMYQAKKSGNGQIKVYQKDMTIDSIAA